MPNEPTVPNCLIAEGRPFARWFLDTTPAEQLNGQVVIVEADETGQVANCDIDGDRRLPALIEASMPPNTHDAIRLHIGREQEKDGCVAVLVIVSPNKFQIVALPTGAEFALFGVCPHQLAADFPKCGTQPYRKVAIGDIVVFSEPVLCGDLDTPSVTIVNQLYEHCAWILTAPHPRQLVAVGHLDSKGLLHSVRIEPADGGLDSISPPRLLGEIRRELAACPGHAIVIVDGPRCAHIRALAECCM